MSDQEDQQTPGAEFIFYYWAGPQAVKYSGAPLAFSRIASKR